MDGPGPVWGFTVSGLDFSCKQAEMVMIQAA